MTRRYFLKLLSRCLALTGLWTAAGKILPGPTDTPAEAATATIRHIRQIVTRQPAMSRTIMWETGTDIACRLEVAAIDAGTQTPAQRFYQPHAHMLRAEDQNVYVYAAAATDLQPGTAYRYRIVANDPAATPLSDWHELQTPAAAAGAFSALFYSDSQCAGDYSVWHRTLAAGWGKHPAADFWADIGDLTDNGQSAWHWDNFQTATASYMADHMMVPVMGNHECYGLDWKFCRPEIYLGSYELPPNGSARYQGYYYSFDYGCVHFSVLNTQQLELADFAPDIVAEQLSWLRQDIASSPDRWHIVLMHKDILAYDEAQPSTGTSGGFSDTGRAFMPTFDALGIDLVLTGHMHTYRRRGPLYDFKNADRGTIYVMAGPAGGEHYTVPADPLDQAAIAQPTEENYLYLEASPARLQLSCYTASGRLVDSCTISR